MEFEFRFLTADISVPAQPEPDEPVTEPTEPPALEETPEAPGNTGAQPPVESERPGDIGEGDAETGEVAPVPSESGGQQPEDAQQPPADKTGGDAGSERPEESRPVQSQRPEQSGQTGDERQDVPSDGKDIVGGIVEPSGNGKPAEDTFDQTQTISGSTMTIEPSQETQHPHLNLALPFFGGVLAALLIGAVGAALYRRRRKGAKIHDVSMARSGVVTAASIHELGARDDQQDAFGITGEDSPEHGVLAAVADGMGGLVNSGQVSSALIEGMMEAYAPDSGTAPARQLQMLFIQALGRVEKLMQDSTVQSGSTLVACLVKDNGLSWLNVGDSHIYLWRGGGLVQLNQDHDFRHDLTMLAMQGDMELSEADSDPRRENLTSYIGKGFPRKVDWNQEPVRLMAGDKVLLVSDGVYRALSQEEMADCLCAGAQQSVQELRAVINKKNHPQQDNYTAIVLEIG